MIWLGCFIVAFVAVRLLVSAINLVTHTHLPVNIKTTASQPLVSILIPARNEEQNIGTILADISCLAYNNYEVIVYDDSSTDRTSEIVRQFARADRRVKLIQGAELQDGWLGKSYACHQLSTYAKGEYYLYLDADVRVSGNLIERAVSYLKVKQLGLLSIFPKQIMETFGEQVSVPIMNRILLSLLPLVCVSKLPYPSMSAANGQFMLFAADVYQQTQPHSQCRAETAEDITICKYYKKNRVRVATLLGDNEIKCRMYRSLSEAVNGFAKNVFAFFGSSIAATLIYVLCTTFACLISFLIWGFYGLLVSILLTSLMSTFISLISKQSVINNLCLMPIQQVAFIWIVIVALIRKTTGSLEWKGRNLRGLH